MWQNPVHYRAALENFGLVKTTLFHPIHESIASYGTIILAVSVPEGVSLVPKGSIWSDINMDGD